MRRTEDSGFTLIELVLSMSILGIIIGSLTLALITFLSNGTQALERDDHSAGAGTTSSYVDRDVASADSVTLGGTGCSGSTNLVLLSWTEYTASQTAPSPAPGGTTYRAAYTVVTDPSSVPVGGGTRYKLQRTTCTVTSSSTTVTDTEDLLLNLTSSAGKAAASLVNDTTCTSGQALRLVLSAYDTDSTSDYTLQACTRTRLTP